MAKRIHTRPPAVRKDRLAVNMNSGYTLILERPPFNVARAVMAKAYELYPELQPPTTTLATVTGLAYQVPAEETAEAQAARQQAVEQADSQREAYLLKFAIEECLTVEGYEGDEGQQRLIDELQPRWEQLFRWGKVPDDLVDLPKWQQTLHLFVISDVEDYSVLWLNTLKALDADMIDPEEIAQRANFL